MWRDHIETFGDLQAGRVGGNDERGQASGAWLLTGSREDDIKIGDAAIGNPGLLAVQNVTVTVARSRHFNSGDVGTGTRLGEGEGSDRLACSCLW